MVAHMEVSQSKQEQSNKFPPEFSGNLIGGLIETVEKNQPSKTPFTPGPWRVYQEQLHYYSIGTDYAKDRGHDQNVVRMVRKEANAKLMAKAPEMADATKSLLQVLKDLQAGIIWSRTNDDINAAMANAERILREAGVSL